MMGDGENQTGDEWPVQPVPQTKPPLVNPFGCLLPFFAPWILWLVWAALLPLIVLADDPPVWVWVIWLIPIVFALLPIPKPGQQGVIAEGSEPPSPPWYAGCWVWPTMGVLLVSIVAVIVVVLTSGGGDGESIEAAPSTSEVRDDDVSTTEVRTDEATTTVAETAEDEPENVVSSTPGTTEAPSVEPAPTSAPETTTTTTTVAPTTTTTVPPTVPAIPLPPDVATIVETNCAVDENGDVLIEQSFVDGDAVITTGPAEGSTPPLATDAPAGVEIDYVGVATGQCPARSVMVSVRVIESVENVQVALALDFPDDVAGDAGYVADPNATDPVGMTDGWDQLFPYGNDGLLQFDDQFMTIDTGATATAGGNLVTFVVPVADDVQMLTYLVQTFFRDGTTADDPIAWTAATGEVLLAPAG